VEEAAGGGIGVFGVEEGVGDADFGVDVGGTDPLDIGFWFFEGGSFGGFVVGGVHGGDEVCFWIFGEGGGGDGVGDFEEADGFAGREAEVVFAVDLAEVGAVDVYCLGEGDGVGSHRGIFAEGDVDVFDIVVWEVGDGDGDGVEEEHEAGDGLFEVAAHGLFEADGLDVCEGGGDAELVYEGEDGAGGDAAASEGDEGVEAGVVPVADDVLVY